MQMSSYQPSPSLEKDGTFTNTERRIQRINKALQPLGDSKPDWEIFQLIAQRMAPIELQTSK